MQSVGIEELHEREGILIEATSTRPGWARYRRRDTERIFRADSPGRLTRRRSGR